MKKRLHICFVIFAALLFNSRTMMAQCWEVVLDPPADVHLNDLHFIDNDRGWITGAQFNYQGDTTAALIYSTVDGGDNWTLHAFPFGDGSALDGCCYRIDFIDENIGWVEGGSEGIYRTIDGGQTWIPTTDPLEASGASATTEMFKAVSTDVAFIGSFNHRLFKTADGGQTWYNVPTSGGSAIDMHFFDEEVGQYLAISGGSTKTGRLSRTTDGGEIWVPQLIEQGRPFYDFDFTDNGVGYICGMSDYIYKTVDGGESWQYMETGIEGDPKAMGEIDFLTDSIGWMFQGNGSDVYYTTDGGHTWSWQSAPPISGFRDVAMLSETKGWALSWHSNQLLRYSPTPVCENGDLDMEIEDYGAGGDYAVELLPTILWNEVYGCVDGYIVRFEISEIGPNTLLYEEYVSQATSYEVTQPLPENEFIKISVRAHNYVYGTNSACTSSWLIGTVTCPDLPAPIDTFICEGESFYWDGHVFEEPGVYEIPYLTTKDCDSTITLNLQWFEELEQTIIDTAIVAGSTFQGQVYEQDTIFLEFLSAASGCDSIVVYSIDILTSTNEVEEELLGEVYPNPVEDELFVLSKYAWREAVLYDIQGRKIKEWTGLYTAGSTRLDMSNIQGGMYVLQIQSEQGRWVKRIVVE